MDEEPISLADTEDNYWRKDAELFSSHLLDLAETVEESIDEVYQESVKNTKGEEVDHRDIVVKVLSEIPEGLEHLGNLLGEAREVDRYIGMTEYTSDSTFAPAIAGGDFDEERFNKNYREAERVYTDIFQYMDRNVCGEPLTDYLEDQYEIDLSSIIPDVPEPRPLDR